MLDEQPKYKSLYNPTIDDIETDIYKYGDNPEHFILKAGEIQRFPAYAADIIKEKLATRMLWEALPANRNNEKRLEELYKLIEVG